MSGSLSIDCGFWNYVAWEGDWSEDEKDAFAECFLGAGFDRTGKLVPLKGAFAPLGVDTYEGESEEEILDYLRSMRKVDYEFMKDVFFPMEFYGESMDVVRDYVRDEFNFDPLVLETGSPLTAAMGLQIAMTPYVDIGRLSLAREQLWDLVRNLQHYNWSWSPGGLVSGMSPDGLDVNVGTFTGFMDHILALDKGGLAKARLDRVAGPHWKSPYPPGRSHFYESLREFTEEHLNG